MVFRVAIIEDDDSDAENLIGCLNKFAVAEGVDLKAERYKDGLDFLEVTNIKYDLVLLDIGIPMINGIDVARKLRTYAPDVPLVFITSMAKYAINGYEVDAMGYVLKPVNYEALAVKLKKAFRIAEGGGTSVIVKDGFTSRMIKITDIYYLEVQTNHVFYHTTSGVYKERMPMVMAEKPLLSSGSFSRCNNCYCVNLQYVTGFEGNVVVVGNDRLTISRGRKKSFMNDLMEYLGKKR